MKAYIYSFFALLVLLATAIYADANLDLENDEKFTELSSIEKEAIKELNSECNDFSFYIRHEDDYVDYVYIETIKISNRMLDNLYKLKNLRSLFLDFSEIDQNAVLDLKRLPHLKELYVEYWNKDELVRDLDYDKDRSSLQRLFESLKDCDPNDTEVDDLDDLNNIEDDNSFETPPLPECDKSKIPDKYKSLDWIVNFSSAKELHLIHIGWLSKQGLEKLVPNKSIHSLTLFDPSLEELQIIKKMAVTKLHVSLGCSFENLAEFKEYQKKFGDILSEISQLQILVIGGAYYDLETDRFYSLVDDEMIVKLGKLHLKALQLSKADISQESIQLLSKSESLYEVGLPKHLIEKYGSLKGKVVFYSYEPFYNILIDDNGSYIPRFYKLLIRAKGNKMTDDEIKKALQREEEKLRNNYKDQ
ncbi:MAG: hypothetical protein IKX40_04210 [Thermoguttaceae bacterium]|nr:hypothetical protein [Thermoguttaceae bacterium]